MSNEFAPDSSHAGICAVRNLSLEMQLERFRVSTGDSLDTVEGWSRRFNGWLAKGRPEPVFSPVVPMTPPDIEEWLDFCAEFAQRTRPFPDERDYIWPGALCRAKFAAHAAVGWARITDWKAQAEADCQQWNGQEIANRSRRAR